MRIWKGWRWKPCRRIGLWNRILQDATEGSRSWREFGEGVERHRRRNTRMSRLGHGMLGRQKLEPAVNCLPGLNQTYASDTVSCGLSSVDGVIEVALLDAKLALLSLNPSEYSDRAEERTEDPSVWRLTVSTTSAPVPRREKGSAPILGRALVWGIATGARKLVEVLRAACDGLPSRGRDGRFLSTCGIFPSFIGGIGATGGADGWTREVG